MAGTRECSAGKKMFAERRTPSCIGTGVSRNVTICADEANSPAQHAIPTHQIRTAFPSKVERLARADGEPECARLHTHRSRPPLQVTMLAEAYGATVNQAPAGRVGPAYTPPWGTLRIL